jgi:hypothetical protein
MLRITVDAVVHVVEIARDLIPNVFAKAFKFGKTSLTLKD